MGKKKTSKDEYSLYDMFTLGDRVAKIFKDDNGHKLKRSGIIMAVDTDHVTILWDRIQDKYQESEEILFATYEKNEIIHSELPFEFLKKHSTPFH